ncbi:MAG: hypothetical protein F6J93_00500 [Oscillatoria sp. SIO1A7]|nr:hypothetical protein [Oscillatoria sp. SIO1A7]
MPIPQCPMPNAQCPDDRDRSIVAVKSFILENRKILSGNQRVPQKSINHVVSTHF